MSEYLVYNAEGAIVRMLSCSPETAEANVAEGQLLLALPDDHQVFYDTHYVDPETGEVLAKESFPGLQTHARPVKDEYHISIRGLPEGTWCAWPDGFQSRVDDGQVICEVEYPGTYRFRLNHPRYLLKEVEVNVAP